MKNGIIHLEQSMKMIDDDDDDVNKWLISSAAAISCRHILHEIFLKYLINKCCNYG